MDSESDVCIVEETPKIIQIGDDEDDDLAELLHEAEKLTGEQISEAVNRAKEQSDVLEDEFAYINQGFTSEIFKIEMKNLPRHYGAANLRNLLNAKLQLKPSKIKLIKPGCKFAFVCFRNEEDRECAMSKINGFQWKGQTLQAIKSKPCPDPLVRKRNRESQGNVVIPKKLKTLEESATPLAHLTYEEQLKLKQSEAEVLWKKFGEQYWQQSTSQKRKLIEKQRENFNGLPCELLSIKASPLVEGYRNKCEFSVGKDKEGNTVVGFRLGSYADGLVEVGPLDNVKHVSEKMKEAAKAFESYVKTSGLQVFNNITHEGHFRTLMARESFSTGELMLGIGMNPQDMSNDETKKALDAIVKFFSEGGGKEVGVTSIYYQRLKKRVPGEQFLPFEHIYGTTHITDEILGYKFRISPQSFFQVNTKAAEVLYSTVAELGQLDADTVALDVCCGIGTIGICISKKCKQVLGVEIVKEAIEDAEFNAKANDVKNCLFTCANSDDWIRSIMKSDKVKDETKVVAILDPPRAGLHDRSIAQVRNCEGIKKLVYVSCNPKMVLKNFLDLCRPCTRNLSGNPFTPKCVVAVDLFPYTPHMELVVVFERDD